jgi:hypothetical protein
MRGPQVFVVVDHETERTKQTPTLAEEDRRDSEPPMGPGDDATTEYANPFEATAQTPTVREIPLTISRLELDTIGRVLRHAARRDPTLPHYLYAKLQKYGVDEQRAKKLLQILRFPSASEVTTTAAKDRR